jgi:hypothetical protein
MFCQVMQQCAGAEQSGSLSSKQQWRAAAQLYGSRQQQQQWCNSSGSRRQTHYGPSIMSSQEMCKHKQ